MPNGILHDETEMEIAFYRANSLINVTLKYTKTADVIRSVIERLVHGYEGGIKELILHIKENVSLSFEEKIERIKRVYPGIFEPYFKEYLKLAELWRKEFSAQDEYLKSVHAIFKTDNGLVSIGLEEVNNCYQKAIEFCRLVLQHVGKPVH